MIRLFGITIHDPDVVFTDVGLAILGVYLGWRLLASASGDRLRQAGTIILFGLASAAFWGAIFHAFFTAGTSTRAGFITWIPVPLSIALVSATLVDLSLAILAPQMSPRRRRTVVLSFGFLFAAVVLLVDESFATTVRFYAPALVLFLVAATLRAVRGRDAGWTLIAVSFALSGVAAALQQARVSVHPDYFDHNALYHVLQAIALVLLYLGFRRAAASIMTPLGTGAGAGPAGSPQRQPADQR